MNWLVILVIALALGIVVSGILLLKQSAKKFHLSPEQLARINKRNKRLEQEEQQDD